MHGPGQKNVGFVFTTWALRLLQLDTGLLEHSTPVTIGTP